MEKSELLKKFISNQKVYSKKRQEMDDWKNDFKRLEIETKNLMESFEKGYQGLEGTDHFSEDLKTKLENRREGIRLSAKSVSRLLKKMAPEKPLMDVEQDIMTSDEVVKMIQNNHEQSSETSDNELKKVEIETVLEGDSPSPSVPEQNIELVTEEMVPHNELEPTLEVPEAEQEKSITPPLEKEIHEDGTTLPEGKTDTAIIEEALETNEEILKELEECVTSAETRFFKFMEKGVSPILDGLYSGKKYGNDLIKELGPDHEQLEQTKEWLTIYDELMDQIRQFFATFSINLFIPEAGSLFDEHTQEPIGVVEDEGFQDEQVKEVVRFGLIYEKEIDQQPSFLLRPAQVIVVKNKKQPDLASGKGNEDESR
ncbi:nucleotide exchange factor GrpE [Niallia sp. Krafla_26]|uniref:nucleotide exchange factor GrpE n=1 Tax=Niallia sp. Krafla_26 TaxID=3064703 RepID=UPI003D1686ED